MRAYYLNDTDSDADSEEVEYKTDDESDIDNKGNKGIDI